MGEQAGDGGGKKKKEKEKEKILIPKKKRINGIIPRVGEGGWEPRTWLVVFKDIKF